MTTQAAGGLRCALCLSGVSYSDNADSAPPVDFRKTVQNIKQNIIGEQGDVEVFISTDDNPFVPELLSVYLPASYELHDAGRRQTVDLCRTNAKHVRSCIRQIKEAVAAGRSYDWVIITRFDVHFEHDLSGLPIEDGCFHFLCHGEADPLVDGNLHILPFALLDALDAALQQAESEPQGICAIRPHLEQAIGTERIRYLFQGRYSLSVARPYLSLAHELGKKTEQEALKVYGVAEMVQQFRQLGHLIRSGTVDAGRPTYALPLLQGAAQAKCLGLKGITAVEMGVMHGGGLLDLSKAAVFLREQAGIAIDIFGFDSFKGLPAPQGHEDHPEVWVEGQFAADVKEVRSRINGLAALVEGDINETIGDFYRQLRYPIGFVALDVDQYHSAKAALGIFLYAPEHYLPAVPLYVDDIEVLITYNQWCGEARAINEFNEVQELRKIERKWSMDRFHVCHVLDHPARTGKIRPQIPFELREF